MFDVNLQKALAENSVPNWTDMFAQKFHTFSSIFCIRIKSIPLLALRSLEQLSNGIEHHLKVFLVETIDWIKGLYCLIENGAF